MYTLDEIEIIIENCINRKELFASAEVLEKYKLCFSINELIAIQGLLELKIIDLN